jgi:hypothetical protein
MPTTNHENGSLVRAKEEEVVVEADVMKCKKRDNTMVVVNSFAK